MRRVRAARREIGMEKKDRGTERRGGMQGGDGVMEDGWREGGKKGGREGGREEERERGIRE